MRRFIVVLAFLAAVGLAAFWVITTPATISAGTLGPHTPDMANGKAMFHAGGCASCHASPGQDDRTRLGGGLPLKSPYGTFHVPNVSSHAKDGIGGWTEAQFITAMVEGTAPDGRHYYPSFPYTSYRRMRTGDLRDLFAFMKTLPAVENRVRDHDLPFPFNVRRSLGAWKLLHLGERGMRADPSKSEAWNRGAYLVEGPGHCAECHSPRNVLGGIVAAQRHAGGPNPEGQGWVPNITQRGLKDWSDKDIAYLLEEGMTPEGDSVGSTMAAVVRNTSQLSAQDRAAMAAYLKSLAPVEGPTRPAKK